MKFHPNPSTSTTETSSGESASSAIQRHPNKWRNGTYTVDVG